MTANSYGATSTDFVAKPYVVFDMTKDRPGIYSKHAQTINFPLSEDDRKDIETLDQQFIHEENCAGLAAPQIGISKRIIVFALPDNPDLRKF